MSLPPVARRSLALVATTALLSGGFSALAPNAFASGTVTSVSPNLTNNSGNTAVTVNGSGFTPLQDQAGFRLAAPSYYGAASANPVIALDQSGNTDITTTNSQTGTMPSSNAAPGTYDVFSNGSEGTPCASCFTIASSGTPIVNGVQHGTGSKDRGPEPIDLIGNYLAQSSYVTVYGADGATPDSGIQFVVGDVNDSSTYKFKGYESSTSIHGNISLVGAFTPGKHIIRVKNTVGEEGPGVEFWQPFFQANGVSPTTFGQGVQNATLTVTGKGIRQGSQLSVPSLKCSGKPTGTCSGSDVTVGPSTVSPDGTTISAPISFTSDARTDAGNRSVGITGPDGGSYGIGGVISVIAAPKVTSLSVTTLGQGAQRQITVNGSGFASGTSGKPVFTVSDAGVTTSTISSTNSQATVLFSVANDAPTTGRSITVTNPDGSSSTLSDTSPLGTGTPPLTIAAGPKITKVAPASMAPSQTKSITITGSGFDTKGATVIVGQPQPSGVAHSQDPALTVSNVSVASATSITFSLTAGAGATYGPRDVVVINNANSGSAVCFGCFGIDSLTASPTAGVNTGVKTITFTGTGSSIPAGSTVVLTKAGDSSIQGPITGSNLVSPGDGTLKADFDLTSAATGPYTATVTFPNNTTLTCAACFSVTSNSIAVTGITPNASGVGAADRDFTITGTNFSHGMIVTVTNNSDTTKSLSVHDVQFLSPTTLSGKLDVPSDAPSGAYTVKVATNDGGQSGTVAYTVNKPPSPTAATPAAYGQGADGVHVTITGPDVQDGATVDFGPGVTVTKVTVTQGSPTPVIDPDPDDTIDAVITVAENADTTKRDIVVTNPDGGKGVFAQSFTVNPGPKVYSISPNVLKPGDADKDVTITGDNFSTTSGKTAVPAIAGVTLSNVTVTTTQITAKATVDDGADLGAADVGVTNPTDSGSGTCAGCITIATVPDPVTGLKTTGASNTSITVSWTPPANNGGSPITSYVVSAKGPNGKDAGTPATVSGDKTSGAVTGLSSGVSYTIYVVARNVAGDSAASSTKSSTTGTPPATTSVLTSGHSPSLSQSGDAVTLSGRLIQLSNGAGISGAAVELALAPDITDKATFPKVITNSLGYWAYTFRPRFNVTVKTIFRGDGAHAATSATTYRHSVSTKVIITTPTNNAVSSVRSPLVVKGYVSPLKAAGTVITLFRYSGGRYVAVATGRLASNGAYTISYNAPRGDYTFKTGIGRTPGNFVGYSAAVGVHRR